MSEQIVVVEYDPAWPRLFEEEKARILAVAGIYIQDIRHIGSTAVPGLGAKPIIDMMIGLMYLALVEKCVQPLESLGYKYRGEYGIPGRHFFHKKQDGLATHHIHMVEKGSDFWNRHLLFRNYLRTHPEDAHQYYLLKKKLADKFGSDHEGYTDAKAKFIEAILTRALLDE